MKHVVLSCVCGCRADLRDDAETLINDDGSATKAGFRFQIEARAEEWLNRHQPCVDAATKLALLKIQAGQQAIETKADKDTPKKPKK